MTLRDALRQASERLAKASVANPRLDAEVLLAHSTFSDKTYLYTHDDRELTADEIQHLESSMARRETGEPVQYIVGHQEFFGRRFAVTPDVLIPRPETELIIEAVLNLKPRAGATILDAGTGSGCIGITLALELPETKVTLIDVSVEALRVARRNAANLGAHPYLVCMNWLEAARSPVDFIVSNPPYVSSNDVAALQREVREHEPHQALLAGKDGLDAYRKLIPQARKLLPPGGSLIVEIGFGMEDDVLGLFDPQWELLPVRKDLQGIPRTICARLSR